MKKYLIIANWKMTPGSAQEAVELFNATAKEAKKNRNVKIVICPPFLYISNLKSQISNLKLGAQDVFWEEEGSFTGEISAKMLKNMSVEYLIIGHSERRRIGETDEMINRKIKQALKSNLKVLFCVGELERDEGGNYLQFIKEEILKGLEKISPKLFKNLIIVYEPVWAISSRAKSGRAQYHPDTPEDTLEMSTYIRRVLVSSFGKLCRRIPILYGGSVDAENARDFLEKGRVDGLLVGRASWKAKTFGELLRNVD